MSVLLRLWPYLLILVVGLIVGAAALHLIEHRRYASLEKRFMAYQLASAQAIANTEAKAFAEQERQAKRVQEIEQGSQAKAANDEKLLADLRAKYSGMRILTSTARCPNAAAVPKTPNSGEYPATRSGAVIPRLDGGSSGADFLDLAEAAERVRGQLVSCQAVVRSLQ